MARADKNDLIQSGIESRRQQREEQPEVPGASGSDPDTDRETAELRARKRVGKTEKHTADDAPTG